MLMRAFPQGKIASASRIAIESDKKSHTGQLLWETKMESGGRKNTRWEQKIIRGRYACALKNPEWWASLRHAGCSYQFIYVLLGISDEHPPTHPKS